MLIIVAALIGACDPSVPPEAPMPAARFDAVGTTPVERGKRVGKLLGCNGCHGENLQGQDWGEPGWGTLWSANLTRAVPRYDDAALISAITEGKRPDRDLWDMPSHLFSQLDPADLADIVAYLRSVPPAGPIHPEPAFEARTRKEIADGIYLSARSLVEREGAAWPPAAGGGHEQGRYIVRATCAECHGIDLRGGTPHPGARPRPDLRAVIPAYDEAQFAELLSQGTAIGNRELELMSNVARGRYAHFTPAERSAVLTYLRDVAASGD